MKQLSCLDTLIDTLNRALSDDAQLWAANGKDESQNTSIAAFENACYLALVNQWYRACQLRDSLVNV